MNKQQQAPDFIRSFLANLKRYVTCRLEIIGLELAENAAKTLASLLSGGLLVLLLLLALLFFSLALALFISDVLGKSYAGFLLVGLLYLLIGGLYCWIKAKKIEAPLANFFIKTFFKDRS